MTSNEELLKSLNPKQKTSSAGLDSVVLNAVVDSESLQQNRSVLAGVGGRSNTHAKMTPIPSAKTTVLTHAREESQGSKIPSENQQTTFGSNLISQESGSWSDDKEQILFGPYNHLYGIPGKDIRSQLISAFNAWLKVPKQSLEIITTVVGMLHTASLLVDDVEDSSLLRRGVPVAHSIFGTAQTINSANYVYFVALQELQKLNNPLAITIYTEELLNLHRGQGMDLYWRDTLTCPTEDDYLEMVNNKTGGLFRLAVKLMQAESKSDKNCVPLVNTIGLLFQILDDYKNLSSTTYTINKGLAEDLTEGKFSFPVIHAIRSDPGSEADRVLTNILAQKTTDLGVKKYAISYLERIGSFAYTRQVLRELTGRAIALIEEMEQGGAKGEVGLGTGIRLILEKLNVGEEPQNLSKAADGRSSP